MQRVNRSVHKAIPMPIAMLALPFWPGGQDWMVDPKGLISERRAENIHGSLKSDEAVSYELSLGWRYTKRSLEKYHTFLPFSFSFFSYLFALRQTHFDQRQTLRPGLFEIINENCRIYKGIVIICNR